METVDPIIPISVMIRRYENHREAMLQYKASLPLWAFRRRAIMDGAIATYNIEINAMLKIGGATQPIWAKISRANP